MCISRTDVEFAGGGGKVDDAVTLEGNTALTKLCYSCYR